jgi:ATP-dependent Zn protease
MTNLTKNLADKLSKDVGRFLAYCAIAKACRNQHHLRRGLPIVLGIVIPEADDIDTYLAAAEYVAHGDALALGFGFGRDDTLIFKQVLDRKGKKHEGSAVTRSVANTARVVVVANCEDALTDSFVAVADAIVKVSPPDASHIQAAARLCIGERISHADAFLIAAMPLKVIAATWRRGRSITKSILMMKGMALQVGSETDEPNGPRLEDLHGLGEAGEWGRELAIDLADWQSGKITWDEVDRGILLSGPPGTGKTTFAGALARSCNAHLVLASLARWQSYGHLGDLLKAMRASFSEARDNTPSILFIDEVDAVGDRDKDRSHNQQYHVEVVSALLEQLDGAEKREGVVVVGACNNPERLDPALTRAGRLDRHIRVPLPDKAARLGILRWHLRVDLKDGDLDAIAETTEGWSGAALEKLVRDARRVARRQRRRLAVEDLMRALPARSPFPAQLMRRNAIHEAGHALVGLELGIGKLVEITLTESLEIDGPSHQEGGTVRFDEVNALERLPSQILDRIALCLAGAAAEQTVLGTHGAGWGGVPGSDLHRATLLALTMEASYGLGESLLYVADDTEAELFAAMRLDPILQQRVRQILGDQFARAKDILSSNRGALEAVAETLLRERRLSGQVVQQVLAGTSEPKAASQ